MMDQANEKKIEAMNALSEGDKLGFFLYIFKDIAFGSPFKIRK